MIKVIATHSFRGGTGKSNVTANLATLAAQAGKRVAVIDTDLQSPGIHLLFGLDPKKCKHCLNDYLWGRCPITSALYDVTPPQITNYNGQIYLAPGSFEASDITQIVAEGYDMTLLSGGINDIAQQLQLDYVFVDTHPGFNQETLMLMAVSDVLVIILRPDIQDFQGTAVTVDVSRAMGIPNMLLVVNKVLPMIKIDSIRAMVEKNYQAKVAGILPTSSEMMLLGSRGLFCLRYPEHRLTQELRAIAQQLMD